MRLALLNFVDSYSLLAKGYGKVTYINLLSLRYPKDPERELNYLERVHRFFSYSISNMLGLIFGASLISVILYYYGAMIGQIQLLFACTAVVATCVYLISRYVDKHKLEGELLANLLISRVTLGCVIGVLYGVAVFLLPKPIEEASVLFLLCIYLASIAVAIFQYSVIPTYYILFNFSMLIPVMFYFVIFPSTFGYLMILVLISGSLMFISKGFKISKNEIHSITVNLRLQAEVAEHVLTRQKLQEMALYDNLTKVANRHLFEESAENSLERAKEQKQSMALLYIDLNNFKTINDRFGHEVGDKVLIEAANRVKTKIRHTDLVARFGGDEFVVVLENYNLDVVRVDLIDVIRGVLNEDILIEGQLLELRASIGVSIFPNDGSSLRDLLHNADTHMYNQKKH
ncbi:GGDEF domain-containing protein [Shewanella woodyi]|uniref:Diguanylate cyclase n=1 Tax=Shewanella woodyi (strain ATCC 51908 / MS32) TaxID=392500 RepID=B1KJ83_SHEWM|nr:GGDEF domain-containing protein [Shewanella woodyi]ACA87103.1 diguanylate cyclase [Shewanella woodyi ATCC 51908]